jgi:hypothetical protein
MTTGGSALEEHTEPDEATHDVAKIDAGRSHSADRPGTDDEERDADEAFAADDDQKRKDVAAHEKEMMEIGAHIKGEGAIE